MNEKDYLPTQKEMACDGLAGIALIGAERRRQIAEECWLPDHDDAHAKGEMALAAAIYACVAEEQACGDYPYEEIVQKMREVDRWPWDAGSFNPKPDALRNLVRAGALIAAEIDRVLRERELEAKGAAE